MDKTQIYSIPYPEPEDPADSPQFFKEMAESIEKVLEANGLKPIEETSYGGRYGFRG